MTKHDTKTSPGELSGLVLFVVTAALSFVALWFAWAWYAVPLFGAPELSLWALLGLRLAVGVIAGTHSTNISLAQLIVQQNAGDSAGALARSAAYAFGWLAVVFLLWWLAP